MDFNKFFNDIDFMAFTVFAKPYLIWNANVIDTLGEQ